MLYINRCVSTRQIQCFTFHFAVSSVSLHTSSVCMQRSVEEKSEMEWLQMTFQRDLLRAEVPRISIRFLWKHDAERMGVIFCIKPRNRKHLRSFPFIEILSEWLNGCICIYIMYEHSWAINILTEGTAGYRGYSPLMTQVTGFRLGLSCHHNESRRQPFGSLLGSRLRSPRLKNQLAALCPCLCHAEKWFKEGST